MERLCRRIFSLLCFRRIFNAFDDLKKLVPVLDIQVSTDEAQIEQKLYNGYTLLTMDASNRKFAFIATKNEIGRKVSQPEVEFSVVGPKEAFVESFRDNMNLLRKRLPIKEMVVEEFNIGKLTHTRVALLILMD